MKPIFWSKETMDRCFPIDETERNGELSVIEKDERETNEENEEWLEITNCKNIDI